MGKDRTAIDTIKGYYYQFDYFILKLLECSDLEDNVCIEGIEDIDISTVDETTSIQCKYYAGTDYNHSVIGQPIRLMLCDFSNDPTRDIKYKIYGFYKSGQNKLPRSIDIDFAKKHFFSFTKNNVKHELHNELGLTDEQLQIFIKNLDININALQFEEQEKMIIAKIIEIFKCDNYEAKYFFYNNALRIVRELSINKDKKARTISKQNFLKIIDNRTPLYNLWFFKKNSIREYCSITRKKYFSQFNHSPFERFFLIECDQKITEIEIKSLIINIIGKWTNISKRQVSTYCPYVFLYNTSEIRLMKIKNLLQQDRIYFKDGYDFKDADFNIESICERTNNNNRILIKIINNIKYIDEILMKLSQIREIYQFYIHSPFYENSNYKHIRIQIEETRNINDII
ncbi:DUF4297 family anti-phage-associated protein [Butyricimonas synergistica]|uniref:DUF4297 family anti-phage-associated protein n=1 Tax=Butyricimonas synergistica TaxID=544644 RepID=UPI0022DF52B1|nr:DUF4297 family anti-phage-associated protein [Butyricimonas synergistica]